MIRKMPRYRYPRYDSRFRESRSAGACSTEIRLLAKVSRDLTPDCFVHTCARSSTQMHAMEKSRIGQTFPTDTNSACSVSGSGQDTPARTIISGRSR